MPADAFLGLVSNLYACLLVDNGETSALQKICAAVGADHASTIRRTPQRSDEWVTSHWLADEACRIFDEVYCDRKYRQLVSAMPPGTVVRMTSFLPREELLQSEIYQRLLRPIEGGIAALARHPDGESTIELAICMSASRGIDFTDADLALIGNCLPHFVTISHIARNLRDLAGDRGRACDVLDLTGDGVIALNRAGRIVEANAVADDLLVRGDRIRRAEGRIGAVDADDDRRLRAAICGVQSLRLRQERAADPASLTEPTQVVLNRSRPGWPLVVTVIPARVALSTDNSGANVILHLDDVGTARTLSPATLGREFGFTPREAALALQIAGGSSLQDAATQLDLSGGTARQYLKSIFDKVGVHSQAALLRMIRR